MKTKTTLLTLLLSLMLNAPASAGVLPNDALVDGLTISEWSAEWWKWLFSVSTNHNPIYDLSGTNAGNGQPPGSVFFLAGARTAGSFVRSFTVPEDKYLFFPVLNIRADNINADPILTPEEMRDAVAAVVASYTDLHASIDGVPVPDILTHRVPSPVFNYDFPTADNILSLSAMGPIVGLVDPMVADGYYLMVEPLPVGTHVLNFGGRRGPPSMFFLEITDIITVVPIPLPERVQELISSLAALELPSNRRRPLLASLNAAEVSFGSARVLMGIHHLRTFQRKVRAQIAPSDGLLADELIQFAESIIQRAKETARAECPGRRPFGAMK